VNYAVEFARVLRSSSPGARRFTHVCLFRPASIYPVEPRKEPNSTYRLRRTTYPAFRALFPNQVIRTDDLARATVDVVVSETEQRGGPVFENRDVRAMVESLHTHEGRANETMNELLRNDILAEDSTCIVRYNSRRGAKSQQCN
jgi:hypothetical protein